MSSFIRKRVFASLISLLGLVVMVFFLSRLTDQYQLARDELGFSDDELADLARSSISASLASESDKATWLAEVDAWLAE